MAEIAGTQFAQAQLQGGFVWFYAAQGVGALYKVPVAGGAAVRVTDKTCSGGGLLVGEGAFYCGGPLRLDKLDAAFANPVPLFDALSEKDASAPRPQAVFGSELLVTLAIQPKLRTKIFAAPIREERSARSRATWATSPTPTSTGNTRIFSTKRPPATPPRRSSGACVTRADHSALHRKAVTRTKAA